MAHIGYEWEQLQAQIRVEAAKARRSGRNNYSLAYALKVLSLVASVAAGALGIIVGAKPVYIGLVALIPGAVALIGQEMKFQQKAHYFYRMACELDAILSRALYSDAEGDTIATLAADADRVRQAMNREWEESLGFGWTPGTTPTGVTPR